MTESNHYIMPWLAYMVDKGFATLKPKDIILNMAGARRFALGVDTDTGHPVLGINIPDTKVLGKLPWDQAALLLGLNGHDYIALSSKDIRVEDAVLETALPMRLWVPFQIGSLDTWKNAPFKKLAIHKCKAGKNNSVGFHPTPLAVLNAAIQDNWKP